MDQNFNFQFILGCVFHVHTVKLEISNVLLSIVEPLLIFNLFCWMEARNFNWVFQAFCVDLLMVGTLNHIDHENVNILRMRRPIKRLRLDRFNDEFCWSDGIIVSLDGLCIILLDRIVVFLASMSLEFLTGGIDHKPSKFER